MRKRDEATKPSCWNSALDDEMVFVLLGRDKAAPAAVRAWCDERIRLGLNVETDPKIVDARECADTMERERTIRPTMYPCGCSRLKVDAGGCDLYKPGEVP